MSETNAPVVESVPAPLLHEAIRALGVTHVLSVPDTHQKSLIALLLNDPDIQFVTVATEDQAIATSAGLWMGGARPLVLIQNVGMFASMNSLRGVAIEMRVPVCLLVGQYGRDVTKVAADNRNSAVRLIESVLQAMAVPTYVIDRPADVPNLAAAFEASRERRGPVVVLVGAPTA